MSKGETRRQAIIDSSLRILAADGAAALTFEAIARRLKMARPHVMYYFQSKEDLLTACFERIARTAQTETVQELEKHHTWKGRLLAVCDGAFHWAERYPDQVCVLFLYYHYCAVNSRLAAAQAAARKAGLARLREILEQSGLPGITPARANQRAAAIQMYLTGVIIDMVTTNHTKEAARIKKTAREWIEKIAEA